MSPEASALRPLRGAKVSALTFHQYDLQLGFDGLRLTCLGRSILIVGKLAAADGDRAFEREMRSMIGRRVRDVDIQGEDVLTVSFDSGLQLQVVRDDVELATLTGSDGLIVAW